MPVVGRVICPDHSYGKCKKTMEKIVNSLLGLVGLEIRRKLRDDAQLPVEFSKSEKELLRYVRTKNLTMTSNERLFATLLACKHVVESGVEGDFVECGVWRGGNALIAAAIFRSGGHPRRVFLFDTYQGMTMPGAIDMSFDGKSSRPIFDASQQRDHNAWCYASLEEVKGHFRDAELLTDNVKFIQGDVVETLRNLELVPEKIAVLRLDTDWYESTRAELEILYPRLSLGGVLIVDDYGHWGGAKKAVDEYFERTGNRPFLHYSDQTGRVGIKTA